MEGIALESLIATWLGPRELKDLTRLAQPKMPTSVAEVKDLSMDELAIVIALSCAKEIRAVVDQGDDALRSELRRWESDTRETVGRALAEIS